MERLQLYRKYLGTYRESQLFGSIKGILEEAPGSIREVEERVLVSDIVSRKPRLS
jgi:hypothetical protein